MSQVDQPEEQLNETVNESVESIDSTEEQLVADAEQVDVAALQAELEQAKAELAEVRDASLRVQAEMQNVRRRAEQDVEKAHKFGIEKMAKELLDVADNLDRALQASESEKDQEVIKPLFEGVAMTRDGLAQMMAKFKIEAVDPMGESFNPELHQAMSMIEQPDVAANTVIAVMQKGYTLSDRLLRPAMVVVAKGGKPQVDTEA
ncbi:nucleotide exchange factor GrpE [Litoribrevibacter albus]|uniref:Protein GrpE n=1 Tax=Litoribrevibacter albus TaxID=1473156 RepID=A0AA37W6P6_9GAMM|nr:nucleotide exchange factor GrpE [Litoribrevibacter albus]GLQ29681.1 protein GrpE [Litoribrevibacter albus]